MSTAWGGEESWAGLAWVAVWTHVSIYGWKGDVRLKASCLLRCCNDPAEDVGVFLQVPFLFLFASGLADSKCRRF